MLQSSDPSSSDLRLGGAIQSISPGAWAVGVSGGADSVALLRLLHERPDLRLHVAHLDHETRGNQSAGDAQFVASLAAHLGLPCTVAPLREFESGEVIGTANRSARFRAARLALFRRVVECAKLDGVILAHHADDQAETVFHRLCRGGGPEGLAAMRTESRIGGLRVVRPLLGVRRLELRRYLESISQDWREDASNSSDQYAQSAAQSAGNPSEADGRSAETGSRLRRPSRLGATLMLPYCPKRSHARLWPRFPRSSPANRRDAGCCRAARTAPICNRQCWPGC